MKGQDFKIFDFSAILQIDIGNIGKVFKLLLLSSIIKKHGNIPLSWYWINTKTAHYFIPDTNKLYLNWSLGNNRVDGSAFSTKIQHNINLWTIFIANNTISDTIIKIWYINKDMDNIILYDRKTWLSIIGKIYGHQFLSLIYLNVNLNAKYFVDISAFLLTEILI